MPRSSVFQYWELYDDNFISVDLAAESGINRVISVNHRLSEFLRPNEGFNNLVPYSFFPISLGAGIKDKKLVSATMTGGRTFLLSRSSSADLGIPEDLTYDLDKLGWGSGQLEVRLEVKGAGTLFE